MARIAKLLPVASRGFSTDGHVSCGDTPEKRVDRAIQIARAAGLPLRIAAKIDKADREYFDTEIRTLLDQPEVEYCGQITDGEKAEFLSGAIALLAPFDWPEPFGLVMIEAMACGTPVIAYRRGSAPEVVEDGISGFVVDDEAGAVAAIARLPLLSRERTRRRYEERFSVERMVDEYLDVYRSLIAGPASPRRSDGLAVLDVAGNGRMAGSSGRLVFLARDGRWDSSTSSVSLIMSVCRHHLGSAFERSRVIGAASLVPRRSCTAKMSE